MVVPHLSTALTGPIGDLEQRLLDAAPAIERWFRLEWMEHTPPIYAALPVHNAGAKLAPGAVNLFPADWHLLHPGTLPLAMQAAQAAIEKICPQAHSLLLIARNGRPKGPYLASLARLLDIFSLAGLRARLGSIDPALPRSVRLKTAEGQPLLLEPVLRTNGRLKLPDFEPCTVLLNTPLSSGVPGILEELQDQHLLPPLHAVSPARRLSRYLQRYSEAAKRLAKLLGMDPWLITPLSSAGSSAHAAQPASGQALQSLQASAETLLQKIRRKYREYGLQAQPFITLHADHAPPGAPPITVHSPAELSAPQRRASHSPAWPTGDWVLQEGVPQQERIQAQEAVPHIYSIDRYVVGGFYRLPPAAKPSATPQASPFTLTPPSRQSAAPNRFYLYGVIARLALVAASCELEVLDPAQQSL